MNFTVKGHNPVHILPQSVNDAVDSLMSDLPLKDKTKIAGMDYYDLYYLQLNHSSYIRDRFRIWEGNKELMDSCSKVANRKNISVEDATSIIIEELWKRLKKSHSIKLVK